jgi:hypothetical protein
MDRLENLNVASEAELQFFTRWPASRRRYIYGKYLFGRVSLSPI